MKPAPFTYHRPGDAAEAVRMLGDLGPSGKVLAGGQSLVPLLSMRLAAPAHLVDINPLRELDTIEVSDSHVRVGALARQTRLEHDDAAAEAAPLLRQTLVHVAHPTIRNRGTAVGSVVHADPAAELPAALLLLDGVVELSSIEGTRELSADEFFLGAMESAARPDELAVAVRFDRQPHGAGSAFVELARRRGDYAMCGVAAVVTTDSDEALTSARAALVNVGGRPVLVDLTPAIAGSGGGFDRDRLQELVDTVIAPEPDIHASAEYRRHLAHVLTHRALQQAHRHAVRRRRSARAA